VRLGTLSLATSEDFIEKAILRGVNELRVRYTNVELDQAIDLAKLITILVGLNAKEKITFDELRNPSSKVRNLYFKNDYLALGAIALAFQNEGTMLRTAVIILQDPMKGQRHLACLNNKAAYSPVPFEYMWRAVSRYNRANYKPTGAAPAGPVETLVRDFLTRDTDKAKCFLELNNGAPMTKYYDEADAAKNADVCWIFNPIWRKLNTTP
jgi:hypothetical protein